MSDNNAEVADAGPSPAPQWVGGTGIGAGWPDVCRQPLTRVAARMREVGAVQFGGPFKLAAGGESDHYFNVKRLLLDPAGLMDVATLVAVRLMGRHGGVTCLGGPELGAVPLVGACLVAWQSNYSAIRPLNGFIVRKSAKGHGTRRRIEGDVPAGSRAALVEDVTTTAGSVLDAMDQVEAAGSRVEVVFVVVNRGGEPARRAVESRGAAFVPLFDSEAVLAFCRPALSATISPFGVTDRAG